MSVFGLNWQTWSMKFVAGLDQKTDARALAPPGLSRAVDLQMDEVGGVQTRYPFVADANDVLDAADPDNDTLADCRRLVENGDEWLLFTKTALYSWSPQLSKWVRKGTHLACKLTEQSRFVNTAEQIDGDRAELDNAIVFAWTEDTGGGTESVFVAAIDKTTQTVTVAPTELALESRARLVALDTVVLLFTKDNSSGILGARALDPADIATGIASSATTVVASPPFNTYYDATRQIGADAAIVAARGTPTTSYSIAKVTSALVVTTSTKARTCDGPIAVSCTPDGVSMQIVRANAGNIQGDLITISTLADVYTAQAIGTSGSTTNQIAAAHRSVTDGGQYRCYVFWSYDETDDSYNASFGTKSNWVNTGNSLGTEADFVDHVGVASRAFDHDGSVYVWLTFALTSYVSNAGGVASAPEDQLFGRLQNTYFMYRDDAFLCAKAAPNVGGGYSAATGHLPGVANVGTNQYAWCGIERRLISLGSDQEGYSARAPRDISVEFDSDEARRCARLGETLYITGGEILQYDGTQLVECGFHIFPWQLDLTDTGAGSLSAGTYPYQMTWRWDSGKGERDRSTSGIAGIVTPGASREVTVLPWCNLNVTHKTDSPPAAEIWRTAVNPTDEAPFYLVTNSDPTDTAGDNHYLATDSTAMSLSPGVVDDFADATLATKEAHPENGGQLKNLAPPAASLILATDTRLFLAGVSGDPHRVLYSKYRGANQVASFFGALAVDIPQEGGAITALAVLNEAVVVFRETAIYVLDGQGFDNTGGGSNYAARRIPGKLGAVSQEAVSLDTERGIYFKSKKGWYVLNHGWQVEYVGGGVVDYDSEEVLSVDAIEKQHQIRVLTASRMLVLDTLVGQWFEWSISDGVHSCMFDGAHTYLTDTGPKTQATSYASGCTYGIDLELAFLRLNDLQGYGAVDFFQLLGEFVSSCSIRIRLARDDWKDGADTYFQDKTHTPSLTAGKPLELQHSPSIKQLKSLKVRITVTPSGSGEAVKLTGLAFRLGVTPGLNRNLPVAQKQ